MSRNPPVPHPTLSLNLRARDCADELLHVIERQLSRRRLLPTPPDFPHQHTVVMLWDATRLVRLGRSARYTQEVLTPVAIALAGWIQLLLSWRGEGKTANLIYSYESWLTEHHPELRPPFYDVRWKSQKFRLSQDRKTTEGHIAWIRWMRDEIAKGGE